MLSRLSAGVCSRPGVGHFRNWVVAVHTLHGMDVVGTGPAHVRGIHVHHIHAATGHCRMTGVTGIPEGSLE